MEPKWLPESPGISRKPFPERPRNEKTPPSATRSTPGTPTRPPECPKGPSRDPFKQPREPKCTPKDHPGSSKGASRTSQSPPGSHDTCQELPKTSLAPLRPLTHHPSQRQRQRQRHRRQQQQQQQQQRKSQPQPQPHQEITTSSQMHFKINPTMILE